MRCIKTFMVFRKGKLKQQKQNKNFQKKIICKYVCGENLMKIIQPFTATTFLTTFYISKLYLHSYAS